MVIFGFLDSISGSDALFYFLMILLVIVTIVLSYLIYSQNKEMAKKLKENSLFEEDPPKKVESVPTSIKEVETLVKERPQIVEVTDMSIPDYMELTQSFNVIPEKEIEDINVVSEENVQTINEISEEDDLQTITRELETIPKNRKIEMTSYEEEQEKTAIISYDELVKQADEKVSVNESQIVTDKKAALEAVEEITNEIEEHNKVIADNSYDDIVNELNEEVVELPASNNIQSDINNNYVHEEKFLSGLKTLLNMLRE